MRRLRAVGPRRRLAMDRCVKSRSRCAPMHRQGRRRFVFYSYFGGVSAQMASRWEALTLCHETYIRQVQALKSNAMQGDSTLCVLASKMGSQMVSCLAAQTVRSEPLTGQAQAIYLIAMAGTSTLCVLFSNWGVVSAQYASSWAAEKLCNETFHFRGAGARVMQSALCRRP